MAILLSNMVPITYELLLFFPNTEESCISLYHREKKNDPYTLPTHARTIHEKVGNTFTTQITRKILLTTKGKKAPTLCSSRA
jgi:hypothetical protein